MARFSIAHRGYTAAFEHDGARWAGRVVGLEEELLVEGSDVQRAIAAFEAAVEGYLERCAAAGRAPERPTTNVAPWSEGSHGPRSSEL